MARILDFYAVRWEYEPDTFPILWNLDGDVVESFSPDFYLPDLDLYLEMTTLRRSSSARRTASCAACASCIRTINSSCSTRAISGRSCSSTARSPWTDGLSGSSGQVAARRRAAVRRSTPTADPDVPDRRPRARRVHPPTARPASAVPRGAAPGRP